MQYINRQGTTVTIKDMSDEYLENALRHFAKRLPVIVDLVDSGAFEPVSLLHINAILQSLLEEFECRGLDK